MRFLLPALLLSASPALAAEPIVGRYVTENGKAVVTLAPCGAKLCGRISRVLVPTDDGGPATDRNNPDPKLRSRPVLGLEVLSGFTDNGKDWRGRIYDPEGGKWYKSIIKRAGNGLKVQGCVAFFCRTQNWKPA